MLTACTGLEDDDADIFDLIWSQTNSSSDMSSLPSGVGYAYLCMVSINVVMYRRFASVRDRPFREYHASLNESEGQFLQISNAEDG